MEPAAHGCRLRPSFSPTRLLVVGHLPGKTRSRWRSIPRAAARESHGAADGGNIAADRCLPATLPGMGLGGEIKHRSGACLTVADIACLEGAQERYARRKTCLSVAWITWRHSFYGLSLRHSGPRGYQPFVCHAGLCSPTHAERPIADRNTPPFQLPRTAHCSRPSRGTGDGHWPAAQLVQLREGHQRV